MQIVSWWSKKEPPEPRPDPLAAIYELQTKMLMQNQDFLVKMSELALSSAGRTLGVRGAKNRKRDAKGRLLPRDGARAPECPLCINPMRSRVTLAMIDQHRAHGDREPELEQPKQPGEAERGQ